MFWSNLPQIFSWIIIIVFNFSVGSSIIKLSKIVSKSSFVKVPFLFPNIFNLSESLFTFLLSLLLLSIVFSVLLSSLFSFLLVSFSISFFISSFPSSSSSSSSPSLSSYSSSSSSSSAHKFSSKNSLSFSDISIMLQSSSPILEYISWNKAKVLFLITFS